MACKSCSNTGACAPCRGTGYIGGGWTNKKKCESCGASGRCKSCKGRG